MASKKLFITGATGYIGGSVLEAIVHKYPSLQISALLRSVSPEFKERYPTVQVVNGTFDDGDIIAHAAENADIVIHTGDIDHPGCAAAILTGLSKKTTPSYLIHLTGTGCISDRLTNTWDGKSNPKIWSDITDIDTINSLPDTALHHAIDRSIMDASNELLKTVCICPPDIYGQARGVGGRESFLVPQFVDVVMKTKEPFYVGEGANWRAVTHLDDVVALFMLVLECMMKGGGGLSFGKEKTPNSKISLTPNTNQSQGFYFAVADEIKWKDAAEALCKLGIEQGWLPPNTKTISYDEQRVSTVLQPAWLGLYLFGSNSRADSARARQLGWRPRGPDFWTMLPEDVRAAVARRG
ncbi:hypothetical protein FQN50_007447 [Emmonsiellopsis sp. PD_5]|nr:hypothetical protein FQN50_007447 [Emmonsiellopsis sp. PD_5]